MILTRTPHYITIPIDFPTTTTDVVVSLYVWSGLKASIPATANYTWTKPVPTTTTSELKVNISNVVNDFIGEGKFSASTTGIQNAGLERGIWAYYLVEYTDGTETIADLSDTLFCLEGYGTYLDGFNPTIPANGILIDGTNFQMSSTGSFCIGYSTTVVSTITISLDGVVTDTFFPVLSTASDSHVQQLWIEGSDYVGSVLTVVIDATTITIEILQEEKYTTTDIVFINKYGAQQILTFFKEKKESLKVSAKNFNNQFISGGTYDTSKHQIKEYNKKGNKSFSLVSGFYEEENNSVFEQLLFSESVWIVEDEVFIPVNVETKSLGIMTQLNDKVFGYPINFSYAFNELNDV